MSSNNLADKIILVVKELYNLEYENAILKIELELRYASNILSLLRSHSSILSMIFENDFEEVIHKINKNSKKICELKAYKACLLVGIDREIQIESTDAKEILSRNI